MFSFKKLMGALTLVAVSLSLSACDPYTHIPVGAAVRGNNVLTASEIKHQEEAVIPRCQQWAKETNPSRLHMAGAGAVNNAIGGAIGLAGGTQAYASIIGARLEHNTLPGVGAEGAIAGAVQGAINGYTVVGQIRHGWTVSCLASDVSGVHFVPPSVVKQMKATGKGRSFGYDAPAQGAEAEGNEAEAAGNEADTDDGNNSASALIPPGN